MKFYVLTVFPEIFSALEEYSVLGRAIKQGLIELSIKNIRDFATDRHRTTDDYPFGGGPGMVMLAEPILRALEQVKKESEGRAYTILLGPAGERLNQDKAKELASKSEICLICGHYEGVDARVREFCDEELSLGDFVISGGELPALILIDALGRLTPGVLGNLESLADESFSRGLLEYDQFTRPRELHVPEILLSGHHQAINNWRLKNSLLRSIFFRPDLLLNRELSPQEIKALKELQENLKEIFKKIKW